MSGTRMFQPVPVGLQNNTAPAAMFTPARKPTLSERLLGSADVATPEEGRQYFKPNDFRWAETLRGEDNPTGRNKIFINDDRFASEGSENYRDKMVLLESLHLLKDVDPKRHRELYNSAMESPEYQAWAKESYKRSKNDPEYKETRSFDDWHNQSRFDQVVGGFLMAGDKDIPTAKNWSRDLPFGDTFKKELMRLEQDLGGMIR